MEEVGARGSVTWRGGGREVCFFCEDVAGAMGWEPWFSWVDGTWAPAFWTAGVARGVSRFAKFRKGSVDDSGTEMSGNCDEMGTEAYSPFPPIVL
jgi:hypothetical protein